MESPVEIFFAGGVAEGGGKSVGSWRDGLLRVLSPMEFGDEGDKGVIRNNRWSYLRKDHPHTLLALMLPTAATVDRIGAGC